MTADTDFLRELVRIPSVTSDIAAVNRAVEFVRARLTSRGLSVAVEETGGGRRALYASVAAGSKTPAVLLNAHLDVVPAPAAMFEPRERDGWLFGRGTADCKGNAVVVAQVLEALAGTGADVGAVFSTDEETGGESCAAMVARGYRARALTLLLDAAPWSIANAQKGMATFRLVARGRGGHSSEPWAFDNPLDKLFEGWRRVRESWPPVPEGDRWGDTVAATVVRGGEVENQIPDTAELVVNVRWTTPGDLPRIERTLRETSGLETERTRVCDPVFCDETHPAMVRLREAMEKAHGAPVPFYRMHGATDARHFASSGVPVAILGTEGRGCHSDLEALRLSSLDEYLAWLVPFVRDFRA